jgi:soluble lytic murein transglycosylase-like protein
VKRKIFVVGMLAAVFLFGGVWVARTEPAELSRPVTGNESVVVLSEPPLIQQQEAFAYVSRSTTANALRMSPDWRSRAARYEHLFHSAALRHGVDERWLWIVAYLETGFRPELVSPKGARGMMQFTDATARRYGLSNPHDPEASVDAAARYLRDLAKRFGNRFDLVLAGYNAGEGAVDAYLRGRPLRLPDGRIVNPQGLKLDGIPPYAETRSYVARGVSLARQLSASGLTQTAAGTTVKERVTGRAITSSIFASRLSPARPTNPAGRAVSHDEQLPVIRSIRVTRFSVTDDGR